MLHGLDTLSVFQSHGGKMIMYHGGSDTSFSVKDTTDYYDALDATNGGSAAKFVRLFVVPGMNHCSGGPATDQFDTLTPLVDWVERGIAPDSIVATASNPGYFNVAARTRPLCPYPKQTRYSGSGDINLASSFTCQ
jgi:feruloyl esterase